MAFFVCLFKQAGLIWFYCRRIYPPEDKTLLEKYENLLAVAFQTFLSGRAASFQRELNNPLKKMKVKEWIFIKKKKKKNEAKQYVFRNSPPYIQIEKHFTLKMHFPSILTVGNVS